MTPTYNMVPAISSQGPGNSSQPLIPPATKSKRRKSIHYRTGNATLHREMKFFTPLEPKLIILSKIINYSETVV